jgi:hypothetical protein
MPAVDLGPWLPDQAAIGPSHAREALNCIPCVDHYRPLKSLQATTNALGSRCRGVFPVRDIDNAAHMFACDADEIYKLVGTTWTNYSRTAAYTTATTTTRWRGTTYGDRLILTNALDALQYIDMSTAATQFANLGGSPGTAKFIATYGEFVFLGALGSSGMAIKWSARGNSESWTPGTGESDEQEFADGGNITGFASTKAALYLFQEKCIRRILDVGGDVIMRIDKLIENIGCIEPNSLIQYGQRCFFLSEDGWYMWDFESQPVPIGLEKFDRWFLDNSSRDYWYAITTAIDPKNRVFAAGFPGGGGDTPSDILFFNYELGKASHAEVNHELLAPAISIGVSLDDLTGNLDTDYSISFDDPFYQGGAFYFGAFDTNHKLASFAGSNMEATFETNAVMLADGQRSSIEWAKPLSDASGATVAAGSKVKPSDTMTFQSQVSQQASGRCPQRGANGFYHAAQMVIPAGQTWTYARGVEFKASAVRSVR